MQIMFAFIKHCQLPQVILLYFHEQCMNSNFSTSLPELLVFQIVVMLEGMEVVLICISLTKLLVGLFVGLLVMSLHF